MHLARFGHQPVTDRVPVAQRVPRIGQELTTGIGQGHDAVVAFEQGYAQFLLEPLDAPAERRRTDVGGLGSPAEMQAACERDELLEPA